MNIFQCLNLPKNKWKQRSMSHDHIKQSHDNSLGHMTKRCRCASVFLIKASQRGKGLPFLVFARGKRRVLRPKSTITSKFYI